MIERTGLSRTLGHLAAHEVALAVGDPFVREGTDVTVLFRVRSQTLLSSALARYEESARKRRPDLKSLASHAAPVPTELLPSNDARPQQGNWEDDTVVES